MNKIAENISRRRKELNMTQRMLADKLNISDKTVSRWETGNQIPDALMIPEIASVLQMSINELYGIEAVQREDDKGAPKIEHGKVMAFKVAVLIGLFICFASALLIRMNYIVLDVKYIMHILFLFGILIILLAEMVFYGFTKRNPLKKLYEQINFQWFGLVVFMVDVFVVISMGIVTTIILNFLMLAGSLFYRKHLQKKGFEIQKGTVRIVIFLGILGIIFLMAHVAAVYLQPIYTYTDKFGSKFWWENFTQQAAGITFIAMQAVNYFLLLQSWKEKQMSNKKMKYSLLAIGAVAIGSIIICFGGYFKNSLYNEMASAMVQNGERVFITSAKIGLDFGNDSYIYFDLTEVENVGEILKVLQGMKVKEENKKAKKVAESKMEIGSKYLIVLSGNNMQGEAYLQTILFQDAAHVACQGEVYQIQNEVDFTSLYELALREYEGPNKEFYKGMLAK